jgi:hypothetical protein
MNGAARSRMKYRVTIERDYATDVDGFGQKHGDWRELCTVACHAWAGSSGGKHTSAGEARTVTSDMPGMIVPKGTDVKTTDRVQQILDRAGNVILPAMGIDAVLPRITHLEFRLREMT